jgi:ribosome-binding factor A
MLRVLGRVLTTEVQDDRLRKNMVTVTRTKISADFSYLDVWISAQGEERFQKAMLSLVERAGLSLVERAGGFLRRRLGEEVQLRVVPELRFHLDTTLDHAARIDELIGQVREERRQRARALGIDDEAEDDGDTSEPAESPEGDGAEGAEAGGGEADGPTP